MSEGMSPPAGWYGDPINPDRQRWWNGHEWTEEVHVPESSTTTTVRQHEEEPDHSIGPSWLPLRVTFFALAVAALASLLPWAEVSTPFASHSLNGTEGDGVITLILAFVAAAFAWVSTTRPMLITVTVVIAIGIGVIGVVDMGDLNDRAELLNETSNGNIKVRLGIGMWLLLIGSAVAAVAGLADLANRWRG